MLHFDVEEEVVAQKHSHNSQSVVGEVVNEGFKSYKRKMIFTARIMKAGSYKPSALGGNDRQSLNQLCDQTTNC